MSREAFEKIAGADERIDLDELHAALAADEPPSRARLLPSTHKHAARLATGFHRVEPIHRKGVEELAEWIAEKHRPGQPLEIVFICTANSRRSFFGELMGNVAAAYYGFDGIRCYSGGADRAALNPRTAAALRRIGFEVEPTGREAERGDPNVPNPIHRIRWGTSDDSRSISLESLAFSKRFDDPGNPKVGFAAVMVCAEADGACPVVKGADIRISMPFMDPKFYDVSTHETEKYDERRDDVGRALLAAIMLARHKINSRAGR